jgi:hypothetical protein
MAIQIEWDKVRCDVCPTAATHICIDQPVEGDELPIEHCALCDECYHVRVVGTIWVHKADEHRRAADEQ